VNLPLGVNSISRVTFAFFPLRPFFPFFPLRPPFFFPLPFLRPFFAFLPFAAGILNGFAAALGHFTPPLCLGHPFLVFLVLPLCPFFFFPFLFLGFLGFLGYFCLLPFVALTPLGVSVIRGKTAYGCGKTATGAFSVSPPEAVSSMSGVGAGAFFFLVAKSLELTIRRIFYNMSFCLNTN